VSTLVKICGLTDRVAVQAAVAAGVDAIGFVFYAKSPRNITVANAAQLAEDVPAHVRRVAVMLHPAIEHWQEVEAVLRPDVLQTDSDDFAYLDVADGIETWPVLREGALPADAALPETFVYEGRSSGRGELVDWDAAAVLARRGRMILAGGLHAGNVAAAITRVRPFGVDVSSAVESQPGKKDVAKITAFVSAANAVGEIGAKEDGS
jgi:phosphoribosylanthranilate isomerase